MKQGFDELFKRCGANQKGIDTLWSFLTTHYTLTDRHYHNLMHIAKCLDAFNDYIETAIIFLVDRPSDEDRDIIYLALWFHDVIYVPESTANEEASAVVAERMLSEYTTLTKETIQKVADCIIATKHQKPSESHIERIVCDIDLVSLAARENEFYVNNINIRNKYSHFSDEVFYEGNKVFLKSLLDNRITIYQTSPFRDMYEKRARTNILNRINSYDKEKGDTNEKNNEKGGIN
jgi:predicted metal-dependent HD superfamily phosphohydrolase